MPFYLYLSIPHRRQIYRAVAPFFALWCVFGAACLLGACSGGPRSDLEILPINNYLQKPGDFLGNRYVLRAQINEQLKWEKGLGRVLAVVVEGSDTRLPIFVPESVGENLHVGQRYEVEVIIEQGGLIYVEALRKY